MAVKKEAKTSVLDQQNITHALCYLPYFLGPILMFFFANTDKKPLMKHVYYSSMFAIIAIIFAIITSIIFSWVITLVYLWVSWFIAYKIYMWWNIQIDLFDDLEDKAKERFHKQ